MPKLTYDRDCFYVDGEKKTILSGAIHYFRVHPEYWRDRLLKLKQCGFNTLETYVCWNLHESEPGKFDFSGRLDLAEYIRIAQELELYVILRPGPYICAEWEFGGFPYWLTLTGCKLRCMDDVYLSAVRKYMNRVIDEVHPYLADNGGNILMLQVENEYGSYGCDKEYLAELVKIYRECGVGDDTVLFTSDGGCHWMLSGGTSDGLLAVVNYGVNENEFSCNNLKERFPNQPIMCGEYWAGWFSHWGNESFNEEPGICKKDLEYILDRGGSINMYMFHGGTSFGFMTGANFNLNGQPNGSGKYLPDTTSYDYGAPISEAGDLTPKYFEIRDVIEKRFGKLPPITVKNSEKKAYGEIKFTEIAPLMKQYRTAATQSCHSALPMNFEDMHQAYGFMMYEAYVKGPIEPLPLIIDTVHDYAHLFIDGEYKASYLRSEPREPVVISPAEGESTHIEILCENLGRINYGPRMGVNDRKGVFGVRIGQQYIHGWNSYSLPIEFGLDRLCFEPLNEGLESEKNPDMCYPAFYKGILDASETKDTFISLKNFGEGVVVVNNFVLGRYFNRKGPQMTLYIPAPLLKHGKNEIIVFETEGCSKAVGVLTDTPEI